MDLGERTKFVEANEEDGFVDFEAQDFGFDEGEGAAVYFDDAFAAGGDVLVSCLFPFSLALMFIS